MAKNPGKSITRRAADDMLAKFDADIQVIRLRFSRYLDQLDAYFTQKMAAQEARQQQPPAPHVAPPAAPTDAAEAAESHDPQLLAFFEQMKRSG